MKISEIPNVLWKAKRYLLKNDIENSGIVENSITIQRVTGRNAITIFGSTIPMVYDCDKNELRVWSKCSKYSGREISVYNLVELQKIVDYWYWAQIGVEGE